MTQEQKAKAYDEAIKRAKHLHKDAVDMGEKTYSKICEFIFPELKELDDERIRNIIKQSLKSYFEGKLSIGTNDVDYAICLAWLEKQGEQKPAWSEEDEKMVNELIELVERSPIPSAHQLGLIGLLKSLRPQKQWKPSEEQMQTIGFIISYHVFAEPKKREILKKLFEQLKAL